MENVLYSLRHLCELKFKKLTTRKSVDIPEKLLQADLSAIADYR